MYTGPNRTMIPLALPDLTSTSFLYRNRGFDDGTVNLNRPSDVIMPTGLFCCEIPDIAGDNQSLCAYIGKKYGCMSSHHDHLQFTTDGSHYNNNFNF